MAKLLLKAGSGPQEIPLDGSPLTLGRRADNRVRLEDSFASGRHATISQRSRDWWLEDHNSSNGTFLNGARVTGLTKLKDGDRITIGQQDYLFQDVEDLSGATVILPAAPAQAAPVREPGVRQSHEPTRVVPPGMNLGKIAATDVGMLDALVGSIRSHRDKEKAEREAQQKKLREQWVRMLNYAEELKAKVGTDPRVKHFNVSRRANDILIRFQRSAGSPVEMLYFSLAHPDQADHALTGIWFRRTGEPDRCLENADAAATELVNEMAFLIA